jgi:hypothetical protein
MRRGLVIAVSICALAAAAPAARAETPAPGCAGLHLTDTRGDILEGQPAGLDYVAGWADRVGDRAAINLQVADLVIENTPGQTFRAYDLEYTVNGVTTFLRASVDATGQVGFWQWKSNPYLADTAEGEMFPGPDGVVRFVLPDVKPGDVIKRFSTAAREWYGIPPLGGLKNDVDRAATKGSIDYAVGSCPAPAPALAAPELATVAPAPAGTAAAPTAATTLPVTVGHVKRRGRTLALRLTASERIDALEVQLRGGRTVTAGGLPSLTGTRTLKLRLPKRLKAGRYTLSLTGTVAGTQRTLVTRIRIGR